MPLVGADKEVNSLYNQADNSFRELVAFVEIITEMSGRSNLAIVSEWLEEHEGILDRKKQPEFFANLARFRDLIGRVIDKHPPDDESGSYRMYIPEDEVDPAFESFMANLIYRFVNRIEVVGRALLIAAESSFEVLFGQLARVVYSKNPSALSNSEYAFTLEELSGYSSIEEARDALISRRVDGLLRESFGGWGKWLKRTVNISLDQALPDWPKTSEIFVRRNMLVHTDGRITERYIAELRRLGSDVSGLKVGQSLTPSVTYLGASLQRLAALEVILVFQVVSRLQKDLLDGAAGQVADKLEFCVTRRMWDAACLIASSFGESQCKRNIQLSIMANGWIARKCRDGASSIRDEVSAWDTSGLDEKYALTRKILLDELTPDALAAAIEDGIFDRFQVATHPLFDEFRKQESNEP